MLGMGDLLGECRKVFDSGNVVDVDQVMSLLASYTSKPEEWKKFAKFDRHKYTRNLVDEGNGKYNIMLLCWGEGMASTIHDHSNAHCFMKNLRGHLIERRYDFPTEELGVMIEKGNQDLKLNQVAYINDELGLHRVENPSHTNVAVSLHIYIPPFDQCHIFDPRTGKQNVSKMTFWSRYGKRIPFQIHEKTSPAAATAAAAWTVQGETEVNTKNESLDNNVQHHPQQQAVVQVK
ncbi:unnamed protein product [Notodromas monacha]|uniref:Cysteine dioxygenase n=1 Tax=Notodromas monacha TaxID=399045 RepID=A0A7R9BYD7_9CRUS|nr:unnamed protein product [Notodromas monacha]CAG0924060.1 unnamed protein product [Notodromas monacha]